MKTNKTKLKPVEKGLSKLLSRLLRNKKFRKEWCTPDVDELVFLRKMKGWTQEELARRVGTKQEAISRLENNSDEATLKFIGRVAYALGYKTELTFKDLT